MIKLLLQMDNESVASGLVMYREATGILYAKLMVYTIIIWLCVGVNMGAQILLLIIDRKVLRFVSAHYETCELTHLRYIGLLSAKMCKRTEELNRKCFREKTWKSFKKTQKSFRKMAKSCSTYIGTRRSKKVPE